MRKIEMFAELLREEVNKISDTRFEYVIREFCNDCSICFSFKLGTVYEDFYLCSDFLNSNDLAIMRYTAAKLADEAYKCLIRKMQYDYRHILVDLLDAIKFMVQKSSILDFKMIDVEYCVSLSSAKVKFEIFNLKQSYDIHLEDLQTFSDYKKYAEYIVSRVIANAANVILCEVEKDLK